LALLARRVRRLGARRVRFGFSAPLSSEDDLSGFDAASTFGSDESSEAF